LINILFPFSGLGNSGSGTMLVGDPSWACAFDDDPPLQPLYYRVRDVTVLGPAPSNGYIVELSVQPLNFTELFQTLELKIQVGGCYS